RFFVIKSFREDHIFKSIKHSVWSSTEIGNKRLHQAQQGKGGPIILFFSVNGSGHFCGIAQMTSGVDWTQKSSVFTKDGKWDGTFGVRWVFVKDVPNQIFRHLKVYANENKPVTNSRDTQELTADIGYEMLKIYGEYERRTCLLDDWNW
ncbi:YTH domain-containing protein, partial [Obelidium mucronatum]